MSAFNNLVHVTIDGSSALLERVPLTAGVDG
jgi:hypothetical protein